MALVTRYDRSTTITRFGTTIPYNVGSVHGRLFSTLGDNISTVGDSFNAVEVVQYSGGLNISTCEGITSVL